MSKLEAVLITGRTIYQGVHKESGKLSHDYWLAVTTCEMDPNDLRLLGIKEEDTVRVATEFGSVVLRAVESSKAPHPGIVFLPYSVFANVLIDVKTEGTGMPSYKGIPAVVEPARGEKVMKVRDLLKHYYEKG